MEKDEVDKTRAVGISDDIDSRGAVNATILDYYKKFGRKRDLEQFFSLSTAQSDIKDTSGSFWRKMKSENDSSDSGGRKSDSPHEVCRISIRCSLPEPSSSQDDDEQKTRSEPPHTESPPIIIEEVPADVSRHTDDDSINFDDNNSQKSFDAQLDLSAHKPHSPTSSITSQRKLEWDSLADVGYANESDRKTSASSLSTLERLALKQQYSNNDTKPDIGPPTLHSTPIDESDGKSKAKKGVGKKITKIYKKDVDFVEVNVPHSSDTNQAPSINVNLTKHISFNVERDGGVTVDNIKKDISISPEIVPVEITPYLGMDKEIQTTLTKEKPAKENSSTGGETSKTVNPYNQKIPVMISLNTLRKRLRRRKKTRNIRRKLRPRKQIEVNKEEIPHEKSGEQLSEAESFEYMPGHMYHQNQMKDNETRPDNSTAGNKSSLESSGPLTTDSSKGSKTSFTKDLEKCVDLIKVTLQKRQDDSNVKKKLIKDIVRRLVKSKYRDDESTTEFLSGLSYNKTKLDLKGNNTTTSTSDANNTEDSTHKKPKKSILRNEKFNPNAVASTSQSAPNLFSASSEKINANLMKTINSNTESDVSSRGKTSSDNAFPKTSSEELYLKYLEALRREEAYKRHLKDKEMFLKQKLVSSETVFKVPIRQESKISNRLKDLMKDLTRNNYDDGSGDASKLEGASSSNMNLERFNAIKSQRSQSVFTLSSSHSEGYKRQNLKKNQKTNEAGTSRDHYCCCPHHYSKVDRTDSGVQVNIKKCEAMNEKPCQARSKGCAILPCESIKCNTQSPRNPCIVPDSLTGEMKYVCLCNGKPVTSTDVCDNFMIYKCCRLTTQGVQCGSTYANVKDDKIELIRSPCQMNTESSSSGTSNHHRKHSKSSQTNMRVNMCIDMTDYSSGSEGKRLRGTATKCVVGPTNPIKCLTVHEATRSLQTEISINPRISDPTLSDINIINNGECAKLISENRRKVSIYGSDSDQGKTFSDVCTNSASRKLLIQSEGNLYREVESQRNEEEIQARSEVTPLIENDYTIPIQSTNTTHSVSVKRPVINKRAEQISEGVVTEKIVTADETTSVNEEMKSALRSRPSCVIASRKDTKEAGVSTNRSCLAKKHLVESYPSCSTYPKIDVVKVKPPLLRSNTDTETISRCCFVQTDPINKQDAETYNQGIKLYSPPAPKDIIGSPSILKDIIYPQPVPKVPVPVPTYEMACQIQEYNEIPAEQKDVEYTIGPRTGIIGNDGSIGIQKDTWDKKQQKINADVNTSCIITKNVGVEPEPEVKSKESCCIGSQTDNPKETPRDANTDTGPPDKGLNEIPKQTETVYYNLCCPTTSTDDPIIDLIKNITKRYTKEETGKIKKKKCFSEILTVLNYLLETEDSTDPEIKSCCVTSSDNKSSSEKVKQVIISDGGIDKSVQLSYVKSCKDNKAGTESSDLPCSSELPTTSSDSVACKVLQKIKKECEKYHQKVKCKGRKCEVSSSTSVNCERCKKVHHCPCKNHKCRRSKTFEKLQKKCIAYNLIIQTSESMLSEETICEKKKKGAPLKSIIVKVPKRKECGSKDCQSKKGPECTRCSPHCSPRCSKNRPKSCPVDSETSDEYARRIEVATVREYLEQNRPDFVEKTSERQNCLKFISEKRPQDGCASNLKMIVIHKPACVGNVASTPVYCGGAYHKHCDTVQACNPCDTDPSVPCRSYNPCEQNPCGPCANPCNPCADFCVHKRFANERANQRDLLSLHVAQQPDLTTLSSDELRHLAKQIGLKLRKKNTAPKFISEREMKKHSERIYKTLPEVVQKKEEKRKENIKKTNLLMANIFKKNLQKQALRGSVTLSNYSQVIKI